MKYKFYLLRKQAHELLEELIPNIRRRYVWLNRNYPNVHMSQLGEAQLKDLIGNLEALKKLSPKNRWISIRKAITLLPPFKIQSKQLYDFSKEYMKPSRINKNI